MEMNTPVQQISELCEVVLQSADPILQTDTVDLLKLIVVCHQGCGEPIRSLALRMLMRNVARPLAEMVRVILDGQDLEAGPFHPSGYRA